jgi:protoporphyrinogen oxidase
VTKGSVAIVGNSIAAMIAALELGRRGVRVALLNSGPNWGGHFSSKRIQGYEFDLGMVGFEFTGFHAKPTRDTSQYDARRRNDVARFCNLAKEYVETLIPISRSRSPLMIWNGALHPDLLMGNDLAILRSLPNDIQKAITYEVSKILSDSDRMLHASNKVDNPLFLSMSYKDASVANHGPTFHDLFIAPFADKLFPGGAARFSAIYHRCLWMPLFYPETLLAAMGPSPHDITTHFHYPAAGKIGALAETLLDNMQHLENLEIVKSTVVSIEKGGSYTLNLNDGSWINADQLIWGLDIPSLLRLCNIEETSLHTHKFSKATATFGFFAVERSKLKLPFSSLFVGDPKFCTYRINNLSDAGNTSESVARLVVECSSHFFQDERVDNVRLVDQLSGELLQLGLIDHEACIIQREAYSIPEIMPIPNNEDHEFFWKSYDKASLHLPEVQLIGPASGYLITTLNDQVIQGLKVANEVTI